MNVGAGAPGVRGVDQAARDAWDINCRTVKQGLINVYAFACPRRLKPCVLLDKKS